MAEPLPIAYLNGTFLPLEEARIPALDRGFLFGDGVYEVIPVYAGTLFRLDEHLIRLAHSLHELRIPVPMDDAAWRTRFAELVDRNGGGDQSVYLQITRGADCGRDHLFPRDPKPTVFMMCARVEPMPQEVLERGASVITLEDIRWHRRDIKTTALVGNVLLRQQAADAGCAEAILIDRGKVTEGSATTVFIVRDGELITPPKTHDLLPGITRDLILELAGKHGLPFRESEIEAAALGEAEEIWIASSTREVVAVTRLDGHPVGDGRPGPVWAQMREWLQAYKRGLAFGAGA